MLSSADGASAPAATPRLANVGASFLRPDDVPVDWRIADGLVGYDDAIAAMEQHADALARGEAAECVWLVEHPALYTAGTGVAALPASPRFPLHRTGRGGQVTYHGPGQRVAYVMLDLKARRPDVRAFVAALERWIIDTLTAFTVHGERREDRVGVWVVRRDKVRGAGGEAAEDKIAAIGIRLRRWVSFHGVALNVEPNLSHYDGIVPCGIADANFGMTSLADLGHLVTMAEVDIALRTSFEPIFGSTRDDLRNRF